MDVEDGFHQFFTKDFMPSFAQMQAQALAAQFVLVELLRDISKLSGDREDYLAALYERVLGRWEQGAVESRNPKGDANFREAVAALVLKAKNS